MPDKKYATAKYAKKNGVVGFNLYIDDRFYDHYPCDEGRWEESMKGAVLDAFEYGCEGVLFPTSWLL